MDQRVSRLEHQSHDPETDVRTAPDKETEAASEAFSPPGRARPWRLYGAILAALIVLGAGGWWLWQQFTHVFVTDARVAADIVAVSSRVPGWVTAVEVIAGDSVRKGDVLARIDDRDSRLLVRGSLDPRSLRGDRPPAGGDRSPHRTDRPVRRKAALPPNRQR